MDKQPNMPKAEYDALLPLLRPAITATADAIAADLEQCYAENGGRLTNAGLVEAALDANRMAVYGGARGKEADEAVTAACKKYSYSNLYRRLCRDVRLV